MAGETPGLMRRFLLACLAALLAVTGTLPALACSSTTEYVAPSNFELVQMADAIGIYAAVRSSGADDFPLGTVVFRLQRSVHGTPPPEFELDGAQLEEFDDDLISRSAVLESPFAGHDHGPGCMPGGFERRGRYLLILDRDEQGTWHSVEYGGGRAYAAYGGEASDWARTVRRYLDLRNLEPAAQEAALIALHAGGRDRDGTPLSPLERTDIDNNLRTPSQWKPTPWLVERYERAVRGEAVDLLMSSPINWKWELGQDARATLLTSLAQGDHKGARPIFEHLLASEATSGRERGLALLYFANHGDYPLAFQWIETRLLAELPRLSSDDALTLLRLVEDVQRGDSYQVEEERWRSEPRAAAAWPELELVIKRYQERLRDEERSQ
ncbi:MAG TPA: hypothetical protein VF603_02690 [Allosphingosinicella sp.]|jgi:hypothetical protein